MVNPKLSWAQIRRTFSEGCLQHDLKLEYDATFWLLNSESAGNFSWLTKKLISMPWATPRVFLSQPPLVFSHNEFLFLQVLYA